MAKLRVGMIGCGGRGRAHAQGYAASDKVEIVACADPVEQARAAMQKDYGATRAYSDYHEMLKKEKLDVVSMCLWPELHLDAIVSSVDAGAKLINAEKPMAATYGEARRMHEAGEKAGVMMTFSHQRRFGAQFVKAKQLVEEGAIGELYRMEGYCSNLFDWGTHWFDMLFFYNENNAAPVDWVMGQIDVAEDSTIFGATLETNGLSYFRYQNGVSGMLVTGKDHGGRCQNRLIGTEGIIEVGGGAPVRFTNAKTSGWETPDLTGVVPSGGDTVLYILDSIDALETGREPELSSRKALMATELIFASYESSRRRARVWLPLDIDDSPLLTMLANGDISIPDYPAHLTAEERKEGFELLFNGKDLSDWKTVGTAEAWSVEGGLLTSNGEGHGWIRPDGAFTDFVLRLDYRISPSGNSGIFLRTSEEGRPAYQGMEIQLLDDRLAPPTTKSTGAIYDAVAPKVSAAKYTDSWNSIEISCQGNTLRAALNSREIQNCDLSTVPTLKDRLKSGFIGLQNHGSRIEFRNVKVKRIS